MLNHKNKKTTHRSSTINLCLSIFTLGLIFGVPEYQSTGVDQISILNQVLQDAGRQVGELKPWIQLTKIDGSFLKDTDTVNTDDVILKSDPVTWFFNSMKSIDEVLDATGATERQVTYDCLLDSLGWHSERLTLRQNYQIDDELSNYLSTQRRFLAIFHKGGSSRLIFNTEGVRERLGEWIIELSIEQPEILEKLVTFLSEVQADPRYSPLRKGPQGYWIDIQNSLTHVMGINSAGIYYVQ